MQIRYFLLILFSLAIITLNERVYAGGGHDHGHSHGEEDHHAHSVRGKHGGKILSDGEFTIELAIYEKGEPPRYRVYGYLNEKPINPNDLKIEVVLIRFGNKKSNFTFVNKGEFLSSNEIVEEPHSFKVIVKARYKDRDYNWEYESHEGRTELSDDALKVANLGFGVVGPQEITNSVEVYGKLLPNENKVAHLTARFPGIIKEIKKELGDNVERGEVLAVIESNQSLQPYEIRSQVAGQVIKRHATIGEFVSESREIFIVADLSEIWADFQVYRDDYGDIKQGQMITVNMGEGRVIPAKIRYVSPLTDEVTQSKLIRAVLDNSNGQLRPGLFVTGRLSSTQNRVQLAVEREAIQTFRDWNVVFLSDGHTFQAMPVELGRRDSKFVEILSGIEKGDRYVSRNSYIVKADIEKSGASHDH